MMCQASGQPESWFKLMTSKYDLKLTTSKYDLKLTMSKYDLNVTRIQVVLRLGHSQFEVVL